MLNFNLYVITTYPEIMFCEIKKEKNFAISMGKEDTL